MLVQPIWYERYSHPGLWISTQCLSDVLCCAMREYDCLTLTRVQNSCDSGNKLHTDGDEVNLCRKYLYWGSVTANTGLVMWNVPHNEDGRTSDSTVTAVHTPVCCDSKKSAKRVIWESPHWEQRATSGWMAANVWMDFNVWYKQHFIAFKVYTV